MHSTSVNTSRITINTAGVYVISATALLSTASAGTRQLFIRKNGSGEYLALQTPSVPVNGTIYLNVACSAKLAAGDFVEARCFVDGATVNTVVPSATVRPSFSATWIGTGN
jgi:hypothetical protein